MGTSWLFSNSISGTFGTSHVAGFRREDLVRGIVIALGGLPGFLWGAAYSTAEYRSSNLHDGADGMWAIGRDISSHLPGIYWLNLFGATYLRHMNLGESADSLQFARLTALGSGGLAVQIYERPEGWDSDAGRAARNRVIAAIGEQFFFDRKEPERETIAPDFGLARLTEPGRFAVFTADGESFTRSLTSGRTAPANPRYQIRYSTAPCTWTTHVDSRHRDQVCGSPRDYAVCGLGRVRRA